MPKVLLIDDSKFTLMQNERVFKEFDASVVSVMSGTQAVSALEADKFDLVCCDLLMPEDGDFKEGGYDVLKFIRAKYPDQKMIVLSADTQGSSKDRVKELGAFAFINKPLNKDKLADVMSGL